MRLEVGDDGVTRCWWASGDPLMRSYHDEEWGFGVTDDVRLFEKVCLEGFQAGLSWLTILRKRDAFRTAFAGFDPARVAGFEEADVRRLLQDEGIVRHGGKIRSTINNARRALEMVEEEGSLAHFFWRFADLDPTPPPEIPALTPASSRLSAQLKRRGWTFVGPTTAYAFMQAVGLVGDHLDGCAVREDAERSRGESARTLGLGVPEEA